MKNRKRIKKQNKHIYIYIKKKTKQQANKQNTTKTKQNKQNTRRNKTENKKNT